MVAYYERADVILTGGHTLGMKVAISIPDDIFDEMESLARRLNTSRSELYSCALTEFVGHHAPEPLTERMNHVVASEWRSVKCFARRLRGACLSAPSGDWTERNLVGRSR